MIKKESDTILQQEKECETKINLAKKLKQELVERGMKTLNEMATMQNAMSINKRRIEEVEEEIKRYEAQLEGYKAQGKKGRHTNTDGKRGSSKDEITLRDAAGMLKNYRPVVHGHWHEDNNGYNVRCTVCGYSTDFDRMSPFCPQCGAKMDEEV